MVLRGCRVPRDNLIGLLIRQLGWLPAGFAGGSFSALAGVLDLVVGYPEVVDYLLVGVAPCQSAIDLS